MLKWSSETKTVKLLGDKVQVNYLYTMPHGLAETQEVVSETMREFGEWGSEYLTAWLCQNKEEWKDAHFRSISFAEDYEREFSSKRQQITDVLTMQTVARMIYLPERMSDMLAETEKRYRMPFIAPGGIVIYPHPATKKEKRLEDPNLVVGKAFLDLEKENKKGHIVHEFSHKHQIDKGYYDPINKAFDEMMPEVLSPAVFEFLLSSRVIIDDISANDVALDFGFADEIFILSKNCLDSYRYINIERETNPVKLVANVFGLSSMIVPFKHNNEETYASRMRNLVDDYLKNAKLFDAIELREHFEETLGRVRNPPKVSAIRAACADLLEKYLEKSEFK